MTIESWRLTQAENESGEPCGCKVEAAYCEPDCTGHEDNGTCYPNGPINYCPLHLSAPALQRQRDALLEAAKEVLEWTKPLGKEVLDPNSALGKLKQAIQQCTGGKAE